MSYGQEIKTIQDKFKIVTAGKIQSSTRNLITLSEHVIVSVPNKLDIEADSILIDKSKNLLTAYRAKSFIFNGKVVVGKEYSRIRFQLGKGTLIME